MRKTTAAVPMPAPRAPRRRRGRALRERRGLPPGGAPSEIQLVLQSVVLATQPIPLALDPIPLALDPLPLAIFAVGRWPLLAALAHAPVMPESRSKSKRNADQPADQLRLR